MHPSRFAPSVLVLAACGSEAQTEVDASRAIDGDPTYDASPDAEAPPSDASPDAEVPDAEIAPFTLTSTAITEGGMIPDVHSCQGANTSPPLAWTGGPAAPGYALVFTDLSNGDYLHSILWDIPGDAAALPENVAKVYMPPIPAGSKQPYAYNGLTRGYLGPCPGTTHTYEYALHAVDTYPLPSLGESSSGQVVLDAILAHSTAQATLTATFTP